MFPFMTGASVHKRVYGGVSGKTNVISKGDRTVWGYIIPWEDDSRGE